jgi:transcriptional regulator with XRE-family HTH domain
MTERAEEAAVLGLLVVLLRSLRRWSQAELARASGVNKGQISLYELWKCVPEASTLRRLAAAVGVPWHEARKALPALRALYRLATRQAGRRRPVPSAKRMAAAVGRASAAAFRQTVHPFLGKGSAAPASPAPRAGAAGDPGLRLLIVLLRSVRHWTQEELAANSGIKRSRISLCERGKTLPRPGTVARLASAAGVPVAEALKALPSLRELHRAAYNPPGLADRIGQAAEDVFLLEVEPFVAEQLPALAGQAADQEARRKAGALVEELLRMPPEERRRKVEEQEAYRTWAVCERAAFVSAKLAAHDADEALALARLAVRMAELTPGSDARRAHVGGFCWGFLGNALRVKSDFPGAEEAFLRSDRLWQEGAAGNPDLNLDGARLLDLKASLRRHQGRSQESLDLLEEALALSRSDETKVRLLLKKSATLEQMGDWQGTIEALEQARPQVERQGDPRARCVFFFNLAASLLDAGRPHEAEALMPRVRGLALQLGNGLDLVRTRWLQGRLSAALGRKEEAIADLEHVVSELALREIPFDAARACLDMAELYLQEGRTAEVRRLAGQMVEIFKSQGVQQEALAAVILFRDAAEQERVTVDLVRRLQDYLAKARTNPGVGFE